jgi:hypothetical protein
MRRPLPPFQHYFRLVVIAFAAVCAVALNHRQVAVVRLVAAAEAPETPAVAPGKRTVVVRERVSLESVYADALTLAVPDAATLPPLLPPSRNPLGLWLSALLGLAFGLTALTVARRPTGTPVPAFARLLGASVAPQAP